MKTIWAEPHHAPEISELLNRYVLRGGNVAFGFMLEPRDAATIEAEISTGKYRYLLLMADAVIMACVAVKDGFEPGRVQDVTWYERSSGSAIYICHLAVRVPRFGYGSRLYEQLFALFPGRQFACFISFAPYCNEASRRFHFEHGFTPVATQHPHEFRGVKAYQGELWVRTPPWR